MIGIIIAVIPALYFSYTLFTWGGIPFSGYTAEAIINDPLRYVLTFALFWIMFGFVLGILGSLAGWVYKKNKSNNHER